MTAKLVMNMQNAFNTSFLSAHDAVYRITIIGRSRDMDMESMEHIRLDLLEVLDDKFKIDIAFIDEIDILETDVAIVTILSLLSKVMQKVRVRYGPILTAYRTFYKDALDEVFALAPGTRVLVVNRTFETTFDAVQLLYEQRVHHVQLTAYDKGRVDVSAFDVVVTPGETSCVPKGIERVIDIGYRRIDTQTFLSLFSLLQVDCSHLMTRLVQYMGKLLPRCLDTGERFLQSLLLNQAMRELVEYDEDGIVVLNDFKKIVHINQRAVDIFGITVQPGMSFQHVVEPVVFQALSAEGNGTGILEIQGNEILYTRRHLAESGPCAGTYMTLRTARSVEHDTARLSSRRLHQGLVARYRFEDMVYRSSVMKECVETAKCVAQTDYSVLLEGPTGTGKELLAQSIHAYSARSDRPFVAINCTALPESLIESELFGYERGSFTGSNKEGKIGLFERAHGGTIFLDEIGDVSQPLQMSLLRVLQERQIMRIGGSYPIDIDVRIISATNTQLMERIAQGKFREDLFYRLNEFFIPVPALVERVEDIEPLFASWAGPSARHLSQNNKDILHSHLWPGNIRELRNAAQHYKLMGTLPSYIIHAVQMQSVAQKEPRVMDTAALEREILCALYHGGAQGMGRESLMSALQQQGFALGKGKLELCMQGMHKRGLILRRRGRAGSVLSDEGVAMLNDINKCDLVE